MPSSSSAASAHVLTAERRQKLEQELRDFESRTQARGDGYVREGRVVELKVNADFVSAVVAGTVDYRVDWTFDGVAREWSCRCSCPVGIYCKHAYAVARVVIDGTKTTKAVATPVTASGSPIERALAEVRTGDREWQRTRGLQTLLKESRARERHGAWKALKEPDPDIRCWLIAQAIDRQPEARLVRVLVPFLDRPDLEERRSEQVRGRLASEMVRIATAKRTTAQRQLRAELALEGDARGELRLTIRARVTSARLRDAPRTSTQLEKLKVDVVADPESVSPDEAMLLYWLVDNNVGGHDRSVLQGDAALVPVLLQRFGASGLVRWAEDLDPEAATRARVSPGSLVRQDPSPAQIRPGCSTRNGQPWVHLEVAWVDGRSLPYDEVVHVRTRDMRSARVPGVVLAGGSVTCLTAEPAEKLLARFQVAHGFGIDAEERDEVLPALSEAFPGVRAGVERHTHDVACTPMVAVDLREDDWLQVRLFACATGLAWRPGDEVDADEGIFEFVPDGRWVRMRESQPEGLTSLDAAPAPASSATVEIEPTESVPEPMPADSWFDRPDPAAVEPAERWLADLDARPGTRAAPGGARPEWEDRDVGWWMRATPKAMGAFGASWDGRPEGAEFFGNSRVQRLFGPGRSVVPKLKIHASGVDWFRLSADWYSEALAFDESDLSILRSATTRFVKLSSGWVQRDAAEQADAGAALLAELGLEAGGEEEKLSLWQLAAVSPETLDQLQAEGADPETVEAVRELRGRIEAFQGVPGVDKPLALQAELRPYQQEGVDFLSYGADLGLGTILADDMGLGKTLQALAWLASNIEREPVGGPSLVVCPTSVQSNWFREAQRFLPDLDVVVMERGARRHALWEDIGERDLVITNYALLRRDMEHWKEISLRAVIFDEAQNLKNPDAAATRAARQLDARHRVALTGTPLENRTLDLWSILSVVSPGFLGSRRTFSEHFDQAELPPHRRALLSARLRPLLLRRLKREVAPDLPDRIEETLECEMTPGQRKLYVAEVARSRALVEEISASKDGLKKNRIEVLAALTRLRQICCHPALGGGEGAETLGSGKLEALFELLEPLIAEGHKVLVFSQFVGYLQIVEEELERRGIPQYLLTGATRDRPALIDAFTNDPRAAVFLLSLKAGGAGLNLTSASYVVLLDPWWNPAAEAQAIDRSHRIGQDRTVIAYRLVARGTIEEKILELQEKKAALMRDVLGEEGLSGRLTRDDLSFLLEPTEDV